MTHGIEPFFPTWLIVIESFFFWHDSKNWTLFGIWLKELKIFHEFLTQRIESFLNMTRKSELFSWMWLTELNFLWLKELSFFSMTKILLNTTQRIEPFFFWKFVQRTFFQYDSLNWTYFSALPIEWNTWENDSKNWTFIAIKHDTKNWTSCEIKFVLHDPKNWTFSNMTQRIEPFWPDSKNWAFFFFFFFLNVTHRIEFFFLKVTQRIELFWKMTPRIDFLKNITIKKLVFGWDSKNWLFKNYSQNWNIFPCDS